MEIESLPSRNRVNKMITDNTLLSEEEFNDLYEQLYLRKDFWNIGITIFDKLIDIIYEDEAEREHWRINFAETFEDELALKEGVVLQIGAVKREVRKTLRTLITEMRCE